MTEDYDHNRTESLKEFCQKCKAEGKCVDNCVFSKYKETEQNKLKEGVHYDE